MDNRFRVYYMVNLNKNYKLSGWWDSGWDSYGITYKENVWKLQSKVFSLKMTPLKYGTQPNKYPEGHYRHYQMKISCLKEEEQLLLNVLCELKDVEYIKVDNDFNEETSLVKNKNSLKPCPFCGGEAWLYSYEFHRGTGGYSVLCKNKNCPLVFGEREEDGYLEGKFDTKAEAIEAWNTRHELTCKFMPYSEKSDDGICSKCGAYMYEQDNYCPDCGARVTN